MKVYKNYRTGRKKGGQRYNIKKKVKRSMPLSEAQKVKISDIKKYLEEEFPPGRIQQLEKFEVIEHPFDDDNPEEVKNFNELTGLNKRVRTGRVLADVRAEVDVPADKRKNALLHDNFQFIIGPKGKIERAKKMFFGGETDLTYRFKNRRRRINRAMNPALKEFMRKGLQKKPVHYVGTGGLLAAARNLYDRGEISLEQMAEIERRAKENDDY